MNALALFRRQTVARKLTVAALTLLGPMAVLGFFMDMNFRQDIDICRTELAGTRYLRPAFRLLAAAAEHRAAILAARAGLDPHDTGADRLYDTPARIEARSERALAELAEVMRLEDAAFRRSPSFVSEDAERMNPERLRVAWIHAQRDGEARAYEAFLDTLLQAMDAAGDCANLALDPALDSHALATATALTLGRSLRLLAALERRALELTTRTPGAPGIVREQRDAIMSDLGLLVNGLLATTSTSSRRALLEDANFNGESPGLQQHYPPTLIAYDGATLRFAETMRDVCDGDVPARAAVRDARRAQAAAGRLAAVGLDELDGLVLRRLDHAWRWRLLGAGSSGLLALLSLGLLVTTSRQLSRSVDRGLAYVRSVAAGDYAASVDDTAFSSDLMEYTTEVRRMVATLKQQLGSLDGVLRSMSVPCLVVDREERLTFVNQRYLDLFERTRPPRDYLGASLNEFFYDRSVGETILGRAMREGREFDALDMAIRLPSGRNLTLRYNAAPLRDLDGALIGGFAMIVDLTTTQTQQEEIERLAAFPRENPSPVLSVTEDGSIIYMNPAAQRALEELKLGPQELLPPNHLEIVRAVLATNASRLNVESASGGRTYTWAYHPMPGQRQVYVYGLEITERKRMELQLAHDALHDGLTGLPNRTLFLDRVAQAIRRSRREKDRRFALFFLDLDRFKNVNDSLGHAAGDELLVLFGARLGELMRSEDTVARLGGDEFTVLMDNISRPDRALALAGRIHELLERPFEVRGHELYATASIGVVIGPGTAATPDELLRDADTAMYRAKAAGRTRSVLYDDAMHGEARERLLLEMDMKRGLEREEFVPFFQPIVDLSTGGLHGFEALARWRHPERGLVAPGEFIPLAEETGLIEPLGRRMLHLALAGLASWDAGTPPGIRPTMSVNLAVAQITRADILDEVRSALEEHHIPPQRLKLEITESGVMEHAASAMHLLQGLEKLGVGLSIDDFGTGYSSLSHLSRFPFDHLKIDQSFVRAMLENERDMEIVRTISALAHGLGKQIIAEGVETRRQLAVLREMGCHYGQGYLFSRPVPTEEIPPMLHRAKRWF